MIRSTSGVQVQLKTWVSSDEKTEAEFLISNARNRVAATRLSSGEIFFFWGGEGGKEGLK